MTNYAEKATQRLGETPQGDPDSMRRFSRLLRGRVGAFAGVAADLRTLKDDSGLEAGRLADALKQRAQFTAESIDAKLVNEVSAIADRLDREATQLEDDQAEHLAAVERLAAEMEAQDRQV